MLPADCYLLPAACDLRSAAPSPTYYTFAQAKRIAASDREQAQNGSPQRVQVEKENGKQRKVAQTTQEGNTP